MDARELKALLMEGKPGRLALDEEVLESARTPSASPNGSAPAENAAQLRLEIEEALSGHENLPEGLVKQIFAALEKLAPLGAGDQGSAELDKADLAELRRRDEMPPALDTEQFAKFLRGKGINEDTIKDAVGMVKDAFPPNALPHGGALGRGAGPGARFAMKREHAGGAMDRALSSACKKAPGLRDIVVGDVADRGRREPTMSAAQQRRFEERFPDIARTY